MQVSASLLDLINSYTFDRLLNCYCLIVIAILTYVCLPHSSTLAGSRYGRRSNWFKIHCLIQDQAEMSSRMAEQSGLTTNGQLSHAFSENKDLVSQYKQDAFRESNSASSAHHVSSNGASPSSSEGSAGGAIPSPYSSLFETAKAANGFQARYDVTSPSYHEGRKEANNNHFAFHPSTLPLSPVSPLSPLNAASRFFFHPAAANSLFSKGLSGIPKLYNGDLTYAAYQSRFLPVHAINPVLKTTVKEGEQHTNLECYADVPEQEKPIDLSVKSTGTKSLSPQHSKLKSAGTDHDSGFSPSSNEENNNTSPLDLTSKRTPEPPTGEDNEEPAASDEDEQESQSPSAHNK